MALQRPPPTHKPKPGEATLRKIRRSTLETIDGEGGPPPLFGSSPKTLQRSISAYPNNGTSEDDPPTPPSAGHSKSLQRSISAYPSPSPGAPPIPPRNPSPASTSPRDVISPISSSPISTSSPTPPRVVPRTKTGSRISNARHYADAPIKLSRMATAPQLLTGAIPSLGDRPQVPERPHTERSLPPTSLPPPPPLPSLPPPVERHHIDRSQRASLSNSLPSIPTLPSGRPPAPPRPSQSYTTTSVYARTPAHPTAFAAAASSSSEPSYTCKLLELKVSVPEQSSQERMMRFSPFSSVNEALQQLLLLVLKIDAGPDVLRNYAVYSPPSFGDNEGCWMTAERTLQSYFLTDGDALEAWARPQAPTLIKVEIEGMGTSMTFKVDEDTTVWFIVVRLLKKLQTRNADEYLRGKPQQFGLFMCHTYLDQEVLLDEDSFIMSFTITTHSKLVFKKKPNFVDAGDLELKLLNDWDGINYKTVAVDSCDTVFAALKKLVKIHPVTDYNQYGLYYCPPGSSQGFWLEEDQLISNYGMQSQEFIEFKKKYRAYAVKLPGKGELVYKLDEFATAKQLFDLVMYNCPQFSSEPYWLFVRGGPMIDMSRGLWSYPVCSKVGLELRQAAQSLDVFYQKKKETFQVDYSESIANIMPIIFHRFQLPHKEEGDYCLIQLNIAGILLDTQKSLLEQGVSHAGTLLLTGPDGSCPVPVIRQDDQQLMINIWEETSDNTVIYEKASKSQPPNIEAATLNKLVERLTSPTTHDLEYMKAFLMTYLSFTTPKALFTKLMERFDVPEWEAGSEKFFPIQLRVCNTLKYWIETRYADFSHELTMDVLLWTDRISQRSEMARIARQLREAISKRTSGMKDSTSNVPTPTLSTSLSFSSLSPASPNPSRLASSSSSSLTIFGKATDPCFDFDPLAIAKYISVQDFKLYVKIEPTELLHQCWSKPEVQHLAPNVMTVIDRFNMVGGWVASMILTATKVKQRATRFEFLIRVAEHLNSLHNYLGLMAFISGMNHSSIGRLKFTKQLLTKKTQQSLKDMEKLMSAESSFKFYRAAIHTANPPCLPYLGVYLKDLTFVEDGNPDKISGLINFGKRRLLYTVISEIQQFQQKGYPTAESAAIDAYLSDMATLDENELYNMSLQCEPRSATKIGDVS